MEVTREKEVISKICDQLSFITKHVFNNPVLKGLDQLLKAYMDSNYIQLAEGGKEPSYLDAIKNKHYVRAWQLLNEIEYPDSYELLTKIILQNIFNFELTVLVFKYFRKVASAIPFQYFSDKKIASNQNEIADAIIDYSRNFPLFFSALSVDSIEALAEHPCFVVSGMDNIKAAPKLSSSQEYTRSTEKVRIFVARDYYLMTNIPCVIIHQASDSKKYSVAELDRIKESADMYYTINDYPEAIKRYTKYLCNASYIDMEVLLHMAHAFYCQNDFHLAIGCMEYLYYSDNSLLLSEDDEDMYYELCYKRAKKIVYRYFLDNSSDQSINFAAFNCADVRLAELYIAFIEHYKEINEDYAKILFESLLNIGPFPADSFISSQINDLANALGIKISPQTTKNLFLEKCLNTKSPLE